MNTQSGESKKAKKQAAIEYLRETGQLSTEETKALIDRLIKLSPDPPPEPVLSEFATISEAAFSSIPTEVILFFDTNLHIQQKQGRLLKESEMLSSGIRGSNITETLEESLQKKLIPAFSRALQGHEEEVSYVFNDRHYHIFTCPTLEGNIVTGGVAVIRDITSESERRVQLGLLYKAIETTKEMIVITDAKETIGEEKILYVNKGFEKATGYSREEVLGRNPSLLQGPDTEPEVIRQLVDDLSRGKRFEGETFNYRKDGSRFRLHWSIAPVKDSAGNITHFISVQRDVTEQWEQQRHLEKMIADQEAVLKEIHHRIKNNLAVVSGLLELQTLQKPSEQVRDVLTQCMNRIKSIAILHETLYKTDSFRDIELGFYFTEIAVQVTDTFLTGEKNLSIETDIAPVNLSDIQAMPCGLILNEVITNSCKHAFNTQVNCTLQIQVHETEDGTLFIKVSDNGCGLPKNFDASKLNTLGMSMIDALCRQLEAEYSFESNQGTTFRMQFIPEHS